jgi:hypothetical protein
MDIIKERKTMAAAVGSSIILVPAAAMADTDPIAAITSTVNNIETLAGTVVGVALIAMGFRIGAKFVNRITVKG